MPAHITGILLVFLIVTALQGATVHVSPTGDDRNSARGTAIRDVGVGRDEIRHRTANRPITVVIHGGTYRQTATLKLDARDSDSQWQAAAGQQVRIDGGVRMNPKKFERVKDQEILQRLPAEARTHVLVADLSALGVQSIASWPIQFRGAPEAPELFFNDQRMQISAGPITLGPISAMSSTPVPTRVMVTRAIACRSSRSPTRGRAAGTPTPAPGSSENLPTTGMTK